MTTKEEILKFHLNNLTRHIFGRKPLTLYDQCVYEAIMLSDYEMLKGILKSVTKIPTEYRGMLDD